MNLAPAIYVGVQPGCGVMPDFALFNLTADLPGHPRGSTVSEQTLRSAGYDVPERPGADAGLDQEAAG